MGIPRAAGAFFGAGPFKRVDDYLKGMQETSLSGLEKTISGVKNDYQDFCSEENLHGQGQFAGTQEYDTLCRTDGASRLGQRTRPFVSRPVCARLRRGGGYQVHNHLAFLVRA